MHAKHVDLDRSDHAGSMQTASGACSPHHATYPQGASSRCSSSPTPAERSVPAACGHRAPLKSGVKRLWLMPLSNLPSRPCLLRRTASLMRMASVASFTSCRRVGKPNDSSGDCWRNTEIRSRISIRYPSLDRALHIGTYCQKLLDVSQCRKQLLEFGATSTMILVTDSHGNTRDALKASTAG